jgi:RNA polymerase sigma factor (sigma-70 family)
MADTPGDFLDLMQRVQEGEAHAARELYECYGQHVLRVIRRRLRQPLRTRFDSSDFAQAVWTSFFADAVRACHFDSPQALVAYLEQMAYYKVNEAYRRGILAAKRDGTRERSLDEPPPSEDGGPPKAYLAAACPTPSQEAVAQERWEHLMRGQPAAVRRILTLRREGHTYEEIAQILQTTPKTVQRLIRRLLREKTT